MIAESSILSLMGGMIIGFVIGYISTNTKSSSFAYSKPKERKERLTGEIIKNPFEHIIKLTPEENARTKGNKP